MEKLRKIIREEILNEGIKNEVADAMARALLGNKQTAIRQLASALIKFHPEVDKDHYNQQYKDVYNGILKVIERLM